MDENISICIAFNTGTKCVYDEYPDSLDDYEKTKYAIRTKQVLETLAVGDVIDAKFVMDTEISNGRVVKLNEYRIDVPVKGKILSEPIGNILCMRVKKKKVQQNTRCPTNLRSKLCDTSQKVA